MGNKSHFLRNQLNTIGLAMVIALSRLSNSSSMLLKSGGQMLQDNKRHACVGRQIAKKVFRAIPTRQRTRRSSRSIEIKLTRQRVCIA